MVDLSKKEKLLVALAWPEPKDIVERIRNNYPNIRPALTTSPGIFDNVTILFTFNFYPPSPEAAPKLELVHVASAGADHVVKSPIFYPTDITFTTSSGIHGPQIGEWVILTLLVQNHHYNLLYEQQKTHTWTKYHEVKDVKDYVGQRLGVLGYGSIGRQAARIAKALGMVVIAYTATPKDTPEKRRDNGFIVPGTGDVDGSIPSQWYSGTDKASIHEFLKQDIDVLLVSVPLTKDTRHLLSTAEFDILSKKKALISNIARGAIIDQPALIAALEAGKLRGAALDVTDPEPLPSNDPLWKAPNVTITPHISGNAVDYIERLFAVLEVNLARRAKGEPLINVIDRKKGY
ncbi:2-hydroxyacid dehydrogenase [Tothia fuscella]|uniref:2-hydroxyacid dehydrogenase n=1 Tax=Tothia fuscella TaxID=1048955 RepID=A0A9P4P388_9PEZI|nr:2-hydroxyacid dehydrogenase [Tothia fuscella]